MRFLVLSLILVGCRAIPQDRVLKEVAEKELGTECSIVLNNSKTFALAIIRKESNVSYLLIELPQNKVLVRKKNVHAEVSWQDDTHIRETTKSGVFKKDGRAPNGVKIINVNDYLANKK